MAARSFLFGELELDGECGGGEIVAVVGPEAAAAAVEAAAAEDEDEAVEPQLPEEAICRGGEIRVNRGDVAQFVIWDCLH